MPYLHWDTEDIRWRCIINGFPISILTADAIQNLLWECGVLDDYYNQQQQD